MGCGHGRARKPGGVLPREAGNHPTSAVVTALDAQVPASRPHLFASMVAKVVNIDGDLIGIHRTFLQPDGSGKADIEPQKASLGPISGGAVRLAPAAETLLVGEGIETCIAALQATPMPAWAAR